MKSVVPVLLILLAAQATSGARLLLDGGSGGESSPVTATASGSASGTSGASVSAGAAIDGTTKTGVAGALAKASGTTTSTATQAEVVTPTSTGTATTQIAGGGEDGGETTSTVQVIGTPGAVSSIGFSNGRFAGPGSFLLGNTQTSAQTPFGTAQGQSALDGQDDNGVEGSTGAQALSGFNNLLADARSLLRGGSGGLVTSFGTSRVAGGNTQATRAASVATTFLRPTAVSGTATADVTGPGVAQVDGGVVTTQP